MEGASSSFVKSLAARKPRPTAERNKNANGPDFRQYAQIFFRRRKGTICNLMRELWCAAAKSTVQELA